MYANVLDSEGIYVRGEHYALKALSVASKAILNSSASIGRIPFHPVSLHCHARGCAQPIYMGVHVSNFFADPQILSLKILKS